MRRAPVIVNSNALTRNLTLFALFPLGAGFFCLFTRFDLLPSLVLLGVGFLIAITSEVLRLFRHTQIRLSEWLMLIIVLGNVIGFTVSAFSRETYPFRSRDLIFMMCIICMTSLWLLNGVNSGLALAIKLGMNTGAERFKMVLLLSFYPLALLLIPVCGIAVIYAVMSPVLLLSLPVLIGSWSAITVVNKYRRATVALAKKPA